MIIMVMAITNIMIMIIKIINHYEFHENEVDLLISSCTKDDQNKNQADDELNHKALHLVVGSDDGDDYGDEGDEDHGDDNAIVFDYTSVLNWGYGNVMDAYQGYQIVFIVFIVTMIIMIMMNKSQQTKERFSCSIVPPRPDEPRKATPEP